MILCMLVLQADSICPKGSNSAGVGASGTLSDSPHRKWQPLDPYEIHVDAPVLLSEELNSL